MRTKLAEWIAWHLPRSVVRYAAVRLFTHATTGRYGRTEVPALTFMDALRRWDR